MCGIAGVWHRSGQPVDASMLDAMTDRLAHRGPDDRGTWIDGPVGLGHRRLSILDLSADGHQPMGDPGGRVMMTYNGEIYNFRSLREQLTRETGYRFRTQCDSEIIPVGYLHWGTDLFDRLEGMFAIALWDIEARRLMLVRDGIGIKPLYVARIGDSIYFASEIKSFAGIGVDMKIDPSGFHDMLANGFSSPAKSNLTTIEQVPPGTIRTIDGQGETDLNFWRPRRTPSITRMDEAVSAVSTTLSEVVGDMLQSDVPVGVLQSGGIDSSLISLATPSANVPLFTAQFREADFDETETASIVARSLGRDHHVIPVTAIADPVSTFRSVALAYDGQLADSSGFAFYELCRAVRKHVTVALSGEGGDEFFAGYPTYRASRISNAVAPLLPSKLWRTLGLAALSMARGNQERLPAAEKIARFCLGNAAAPRTAHPQWRRQIFEPHRARLYGSGLADVADIDPMAGYVREIERAGERFPASGLTDRNLLADQTYYLPGDLLAKADRISMAHGLELRVPLLDRRMMDLAGTLDIDLLTSLKGPDKRVLRETLAAVKAPDAIVNHPKRGFMVPIAQMLREHLRPLSLEIFERQPDLFAPFLKPDAVRDLWREHDELRANHKYALWMLLTLGVWLQTHV